MRRGVGSNIAGHEDDGKSEGLGVVGAEEEVVVVGVQSGRGVRGRARVSGEKVGAGGRVGGGVKVR